MQMSLSRGHATPSRSCGTSELERQSRLSLAMSRTLMQFNSSQMAMHSAPDQMMPRADYLTSEPTGSSMFTRSASYHTQPMLMGGLTHLCRTIKCSAASRQWHFLFLDGCYLPVTMILNAR